MMERLSPPEINRRWHAWSTHPLLSNATIRDDALNLKDGLRSVVWRIYLGTLPVPHTNVNPFNGWQTGLTRSRAEWDSLRETYLKSPDGSWVSDGPEDAITFTRDASHGINGNGMMTEHADASASNPLSLDSSNPWKQWFADVDLRKMLWQDVERTMPDNEYFRQASVQRVMVNILHVWSRLNEGIGYRQGMHELLAYLLLALHREALPVSESTDASEAVMHLVLDEVYIEHDAWALFSMLMKSAAIFYDSAPSVQLPTARALIGGIGTERDKVTLVQPVVAQSVRIFDQLLKRTDLELFRKLESLQIEPQIWGIRWIRLLCGREFPTASVLQLWDMLFAADASLRLIDHICLAMLIRVRNRLLACDYSEALQVLLRYPSEAVPDPISLVKQALQLRDDPSPTIAAKVHEENVVSGLNGILNGMPHGTSAVKRSVAHRRAESAAAGIRRSAPDLLAQGGAIANNLAQNMFERAEALGLNKALGDLKRNVELYHASLGTQSPASIASASPVVDRSPRVSSDNAMLANIVALATNVLEQEGVSRRATALQALRHVAAVLDGGTTAIEASFVAALQPVSSSDDKSVLSPWQTHPPISPEASEGSAAATISVKSPTLYLSTRDDKPALGLSRSTWSAKPLARTPSPKSPEMPAGENVATVRSALVAAGTPRDPLGAA